MLHPTSLFRLSSLARAIAAAGLLSPAFATAALHGGAPAVLAPASQAAQAYRFHDDFVLGTSLDVLVMARDEADAARAMAAIRDEIARLDAILSGYRDDSELARLNRSTELAVSPALFDVIATAERWRERTGNAFSGRLGGLIGQWRQAVPDAAQLAAQASRIAAAPVSLDAVSQSVSRPAEVEFALDAIAKGHIVDAALLAAREAAPSVAGLMIDIGGDVRVWGQAPDRAGWRIGVADPQAGQDNTAPLATLCLRDCAVATSGRGARDLTIGGERYPHTLSPLTGQPVIATQSATVVASSAADADALATAFSVMPAHEAILVAEALPGVETLIISDAGPQASAGWHAMLAALDSQPRRASPLLAADTGAPAPSWPAGFAAIIDYEIPQLDADTYKSPYLAIWITDANRNLVRTLLLLGNQAKYLDSNYVWWRRYGRKMGGLDGMTRPTRAPGRYSAAWDGLDDAGQRAPQGRYLVHVEASREHGGHSYEMFELDVGARAFAQDYPAKDEIGTLQLRYGKAK
ncbi:DUF2271 domain-containing protein [Chitinivorax sp. PXF-14]|uniref:DUF2271 domain-containing protein n=1 Tax=Chitinivorax sp. PXF-14 TaxID=3230488 RepID=UPI0034669C3D